MQVCDISESLYFRYLHPTASWSLQSTVAKKYWEETAGVLIYKLLVPIREYVGATLT